MNLFKNEILKGNYKLVYVAGVIATLDVCGMEINLYFDFSVYTKKVEFIINFLRWDYNPFSSDEQDEILNSLEPKIKEFRLQKKREEIEKLKEEISCLD